MDGIGIEHVYYNGNKLADFGDPTGLKKLGVEKTPAERDPGSARSTWPARYGTDVVKESTAFNVKEIEDVAATGPRTRTLPRNQSFYVPETGNLIGSDKVEGTAVYGADRTKIGSIERLMIDKVSGKVSYAVLGFGGFLGIGDDHYPLPWQSLKYDTDLGGYVTGITEAQLQDAPKYSNNNA